MHMCSCHKLITYVSILLFILVNNSTNIYLLDTGIFPHVTFKWINQCGSRDIMDIFLPDPLSSSFQKPKSDMNIASGCPRFIAMNDLLQEGFIVDDTIFIKVKVDTAMMRHSWWYGKVFEAAAMNTLWYIHYLDIIINQ